MFKKGDVALISTKFKNFQTKNVKIVFSNKFSVFILQGLKVKT